MTGGSGFIGSHLVDAITARGHAVMNLDIKPPSVVGQEQYWVPCDIKDTQELATDFQNFRPSRIIYQAQRPGAVEA